jgi:hypothetical protein
MIKNLDILLLLKTKLLPEGPKVYVCSARNLQAVGGGMKERGRNYGEDMLHTYDR